MNKAVSDHMREMQRRSAASRWSGLSATERAAKMSALAKARWAKRPKPKRVPRRSNKVLNRRGFNHNHGTKYTVTDLNRSSDSHNYEAGTNRLPRRDSKLWSFQYMVWDVKDNCQIRKQQPGLRA